MTRRYKPLTFAYYTEFGIGNPSATAQGTVLTNAIGASNADGAAAVQIGTGALTHDCEMLEVVVTDCTGDATGVDSSALLDILIDPAGGTSWDTTNRLIQSLQVGFLVTNANGGTTTSRRWMFPLWIPSGASFAGIGRTVIAAAHSPTVYLRCWGGTKSHTWWCGTRVDAIGDTRASSTGTSVTPNASANTYGSWTSIGAATARRYGYLTASVSMNALAGSSYGRQMQVGVDSTAIGGTYDYATSSLEQVSPFIDGLAPQLFCDVPEGSQLQVRCRSSSASAPANSFILYGVA